MSGEECATGALDVPDATFVEGALRILPIALLNVNLAGHFQFSGKVASRLCSIRNSGHGNDLKEGGWQSTSLAPSPRSGASPATTPHSLGLGWRHEPATAAAGEAQGGLPEDGGSTAVPYMRLLFDVVDISWRQWARVGVQ
jgi:hypothetical protein